MHHSTCHADKHVKCDMVNNAVADMHLSSIASPIHLVKPFTFVTGLDTQQKQLTFIAGSTPEARRQVRVPLAALQDGRLSLRTDLMDAHLYIFHKRTFFKALEARPAYESIRQVNMISGHEGEFVVRCDAACSRLSLGIGSLACSCVAWFMTAISFNAELASQAMLVDLFLCTSIWKSCQSKLMSQQFCGAILLSQCYTPCLLHKDFAMHRICCLTWCGNNIAGILSQANKIPTIKPLVPHLLRSYSNQTH